MDDLNADEIAQMIAELNAWFDETDAARPDFE